MSEEKRKKRASAKDYNAKYEGVDQDKTQEKDQFNFGGLSKGISLKKNLGCGG